MTKPILNCTDLDRTLLPSGKQPESPGARAAFRQLVSRPEITLAYVSSRYRELVEEAMRDYRLPLPDSEVVEQAKTQALQQGTMASLYLAQGGFPGMNGNYSAGILEGVSHFFPFTRCWME
jgi:hypothetical protein